MPRLPEKTIPITRLKMMLFLTPLWIIIFPFFCFMLVMCYHTLSQGEGISNMGLPTFILGAFLIGITILATANIQRIILSHDGIKISRGRKMRLIAWSEISHIETSPQNGRRFIFLHLSDWQNQVKSLQGKDKLVFILKDLWISKRAVAISSMHLKMSHKDLTNLVEMYFEKSRPYS